MDEQYMHEMAAHECFILSEALCTLIDRHGFTMVEEAFASKGYRLKPKAPAPVIPARPFDEHAWRLGA